MNLGDPSPYVYTKIVGITKPVAVPTMLITASNANAKDLFCGINHLVAILVGAFKMKG